MNRFQQALVVVSAFGGGLIGACVTWYLQAK